MHTPRMLFTAPAHEIGTLAVTASSAQVRVVASADLTEARLEVSGPDEIVQGAEVTRVAGTWVVHLPEDRATTATTHRTSDGTVTNTVHGNTAGGTVIQSGDGITIDGDIDKDAVVISGGGPTVVQTGGPAEPVTITAHVPVGSDLKSQTYAGRLNTSGILREVSARSTSGHITVEQAGPVRAHSTNGDITVGLAETTVVAHSASGDIDVRGGTDLTLGTTSGDIAFASDQDCRLSATTTSGDIHLVRRHRVHADVSTTSGDIHE